MDEAKFVDALKKIKNLKDENKKKIEKIRNTDLDAKKKIITCIVNTELIEKLINNQTIFDPRGSGKLVWIDDQGNQLSLIDAAKYLRKILESE